MTSASLQAALSAIETGLLGEAVRNSFALTAGLSALHAVGFTLIMGGAILSSLRLLNLLFSDVPLAGILWPASTGIAIGLSISIPTGALLFTSRATSAAANGIFQLKMLLLLTSVLVQFTLIRRLARPRAGTRQEAPSVGVERSVGLLGLLSWGGLALAACAYILLE